MPVALRLPDIKRGISPPPSPSELNKRLICSMQDVTEEARIRRLSASRTSVGYKERARSRPRGGSFGLDDFLNETTNRSTGARGGRQVRATTRPTQRQPIDDETVVPVEVFESMLRAGQEVRGRATHVMAFSQPDGRPYLRHHNAAGLTPAPNEPEPMVVEEEVAAPEPAPPSPPVLQPRPPSSCASEVASPWESREAVAMQVG